MYSEEIERALNAGELTKYVVLDFR